MPINALFKVHMLNEAGIAKAKKLAEDFSTLAEVIDAIAGGEQSREMSIVKTKLEEAAFFAKKAMANRPENQVDGGIQPTK
jgi:hypothetical protein